MEDITPFEFLSLDPETQWNIMIGLDLDSINNLCATSRAIRGLCDSEYFWELKTLRDFPGVDEREAEILTWKTLYHLASEEKKDEERMRRKRAIERRDRLGGVRIELGMERDASVPHGAAFFGQTRQQDLPNRDLVSNLSNVEYLEELL